MNWIKNLGSKKLGDLTKAERYGVILILIIGMTLANWFINQLSQWGHIVLLLVSIGILIAAFAYEVVRWLMNIRKKH